MLFPPLLMPLLNIEFLRTKRKRHPNLGFSHTTKGNEYPHLRNNLPDLGNARPNLGFFHTKKGNMRYHLRNSHAEVGNSHPKKENKRPHLRNY